MTDCLLKLFVMLLHTVCGGLCNCFLCSCCVYDCDDIFFLSHTLISMITLVCSSKTEGWNKHRRTLSSFLLRLISLSHSYIHRSVFYFSLDFNNTSVTCIFQWLCAIHSWHPCKHTLIPAHVQCISACAAAGGSPEHAGSPTPHIRQQA